MLDREERERREQELDDPGLLWCYLRGANARIEELEEAYHAACQRCEELDSAASEALIDATRSKNAVQMWKQRAEGYRKAAIILRDRLAEWHTAYPDYPDCTCGGLRCHRCD